MSTARAYEVLSALQRQRLQEGLGIERAMELLAMPGPL
jgi:hypothetical protein